MKDNRTGIVKHWQASEKMFSISWTETKCPVRGHDMAIYFVHVHTESRPGPWFNIKMSSYQYRKSHCGDKTVVRSSYLRNWISYTGKMSFLYWIGALDVSLLPRTRRCHNTAAKRVEYAYVVSKHRSSTSFVCSAFVSVKEQLCYSVVTKHFHLCSVQI